MLPKHAEKIVNLLRDFAELGQSQFTFLEIGQSRELSKFHKWVDGKPCKGRYLIRDSTGCKLWIIIFEQYQKQPDNYYLVLFPESKTRRFAEIHKISDTNSELTLHWTYNPTKRDGMNPERHAYFTQAFLSDTVNIYVPNNVSEASDFLTELFFLAESRQKADDLDKNMPAIRDGFPEGKLKERLHLARERNAELVYRAKEEALRLNDCLSCMCCGFNFFEKYGELGKGYIEAHHTKPVSELHEDGEITKAEDLALVCSNCHRMLHRRRPWLKMHELVNLLSVSK